MKHPATFLLFIVLPNAIWHLQVAANSEDKEDKSTHGDTFEEDPAFKQALAKAQVHTENVCISMMLLGSVTFMMGNFYLVNWPDKEVRRTAWEVISSTVSIFSAVLLFQAFNGVLEFYVLKEMNIWLQLLLDLVHMLCWFFALQLVIAYLSGGLFDHCEVQRARALDDAINKSVDPAQRHQELKRKHLTDQAIRLNTTCWSTLLGHTSGFASINAWGTLQQAVPRSLVYCGIIPIIAGFCLYWIYQATDAFRRRHTAVGGEKDQWEVMWEEEVAGTEDDVLCLAVSFLLVQEVRYIISNKLPNTEGKDADGLVHSLGGSAALLGTGFGLAIAFVLGSALIRKFGSKSKAAEGTIENGEVDTQLPASRSAVWSRDILAMTLIVTLFAFGVIVVLDKIAAWEGTDEHLDTSLRALIGALGILIGFSWERSFDAAVSGISEGQTKFVSPPFTKLILAFLLAGMVIPAWKWYILKSVKKLEEKHAENLEKESEHRRMLQKDARANTSLLHTPLLER